MNKIVKIYLTLFALICFSAEASKILYVQKITPDISAELISTGEELLKGIYSGQDVSPIDALSILTEGELKKKKFSLKGKDLSILLKRSDASEEQKDLRRKMLAQIIAISWKIHQLGGVDQVSSISYKVIDPENKLYKFLLSYVDFASSQATVFAYDRDPKKNKSSHYKTHSPEGQWGIDIRFFANQKSLPLLAMDMKHLLFGKLVFSSDQPGILFLKIEKSGIAAPSEVVSHGLSYLKTRVRSKEELSAARIERYIQPEIIDHYSAIISQLSQEEKTKWDVESANSVRDIIIKSEQITTERTDLKPLYDELMSTLQQLYPTDGENIRWRTGNEVIIDLSRL